MSKLKILFFGTAPFGFPVLRYLAGRGDVEVVGVISQPDRRRGRGRKKQSPPVADYARELGLPLYQSGDINEDGLEIMREIGEIDAGVLIAYGQFLSPDVFTYPRYDSFNFHASLLPRWRGAAPIRHTLLAGDKKTGVSVFKLEEGMDTGPICRQISCDVQPKETYGELYERLSRLNVEAADLLLKDLHSGNLQYIPQTGEATYAPLISTGDALIDWSKTAAEVERHVRAFCPDPGAYTFINSERVKIYRVLPVEANGRPGEVLKAADNKFYIACGRRAVSIEKLQPAGTRTMDPRSFLAGRRQIADGKVDVADELA
ncbi:MAG: methionyl-tRNA formyltransferase [bacterium]